MPHNNRVGDFDPFALPVLLEQTGKSLDELLDELANQGGLLGVSGISGDVRDLEKAAAEGHARAELALDVFATSDSPLSGCVPGRAGRRRLRSCSPAASAKTASACARACAAGWKSLGIVLDEAATTAEATRGESGERSIHAAGSRTQIWIMPTNEELVVARQAKQLLESGG